MLKHFLFKRSHFQVALNVYHFWTSTSGLNSGLEFNSFSEKSSDSQLLYKWLLLINKHLRKYWIIKMKYEVIMYFPISLQSRLACDILPSTWFWKSFVIFCFLCIIVRIKDHFNETMFSYYFLFYLNYFDITILWIFSKRHGIKPLLPYDTSFNSNSSLNITTNSIVRRSDVSFTCILRMNKRGVSMDPWYPPISIISKLEYILVVS